MLTPVQYYTGPAHGAWITSPYGMRNDPLNPGTQRMHYGVDFGGKPRGYVWTTPYPGTVLHCREFSGRGKTVVIKIQGTNILQVTQHFDNYQCRPGDVLKPGDPIGTNGVTGNVTGPHLHYEIRWDNGTPLGAPVWGDPANFTLRKEESEMVHVVKRGDTLSRIATTYGIDPWNKLVEWNKDRYPSLATNPGLIEIGWELRLYDPNKTGVTQSEFDALASRVKALEDILDVVRKAL